MEGNDEHDHDHGHGGEKSSTVSSEVATALVRLLGSMFLCNVSVLFAMAVHTVQCRCSPPNSCLSFHHSTAKKISNLNLV